MNIKYAQDIVAWASQQAEYIRAGRFGLNPDWLPA